ALSEEAATAPAAASSCRATAFAALSAGRAGRTELIGDFAGRLAGVGGRGGAGRGGRWRAAARAAAASSASSSSRAPPAAGGWRHGGVIPQVPRGPVEDAGLGAGVQPPHLGARGVGDGDLHRSGRLA